MKLGSFVQRYPNLNLGLRGGIVADNLPVLITNHMMQYLAYGKYCNYLPGILFKIRFCSLPVHDLVSSPVYSQYTSDMYINTTITMYNFFLYLKFNFLCVSVLSMYCSACCVLYCILCENPKVWLTVLNWTEVGKHQTYIALCSLISMTSSRPWKNVWNKYKKNLKNQNLICVFLPQN